MKMTRPMLAVAAAAAALVLTGCGSDGAEETVPVTATGSLEHLAAEVKCTPDMQTDADELRQALCKNGDGKFILLTFATDRGQREWINGAKDYGGHYLVGRKWIAVGEETSTVTALRKTLGGDIEEGTDHSAHVSGEPSEGASHSGH
ncbi:MULTISPECIES: hypothetical protein [unclassified Streptomyces]|uniref:hypothetical protein n=1 Tax=Streptomyces TaxID=1883 RepID=UPI00037516C7|nr:MULTISPECIES: hypothetical protein [unclassified Streptomyces]MCX5370417.1 hypothetical protein [Streptomyces sp. NBC_00103]TQJ52517.1 hypothetical protein FBY34_0215 [Streptomyces sp. SLBN-115]